MHEATTAPMDWRPDEARLFRNRYKAWARNWSIAGALAVVGGVGLAGAHTVPGILLGSLGGTLGLILGFAFWLTARGAQRQLDAIRGGLHLARWTVDADRWWAWHDQRQSKLRLVTGIVIGMVALVGFLLAGLIYEDGDVQVAGYIAFATVVAMPLTGIIIRLHKAPVPPRSARSVPLIIGPKGALTVGVYMQWSAFGVGFRGAAVKHDPPTLAVDYEVANQHGTVRHTLELPVPPDRLDEAEDVAAALNGGG